MNSFEDAESGWSAVRMSKSSRLVVEVELAEAAGVKAELNQYDEPVSACEVRCKCFENILSANFYNEDVSFETAPREREMAAGECLAAQ